MTELSWSAAWRGRWIWDAPPEPAPWWTETGRRRSHFTYLRRVFELAELPASLPVRATCDSRYVLFVNGREVGRGPVRGEPAFLGWDEHDLAEHVRVGANVVVALCRYYGLANPWWLPATQSGTLGSGSFCLETHEDAEVEILSDSSWQAAPAPWLDSEQTSFHGVPPEIVDGRLVPPAIHDPDEPGSAWPAATLVRGRFGHRPDRPPAAPYTAPQRRSIPQLAARALATRPVQTTAASVAVEADDPVAAWRSIAVVGRGEQALTVVDVGELTLGHLQLRIAGATAGAVVLVAVGEDLRADGLPEIDPRQWVARYVCRGGDELEQVAFFDPVGFRYAAALHPHGTTVEIAVDERLYPRPEGAGFDCDDDSLVRLWQVGARTVDLCSTDAFVDCPGREQRAWLGDAYVHSIVSFVASPDWRLVRRNLELAARSRRSDGLLAMAAACDVSRAAMTIPDFSLHWIRSLAAYWLYAGDEAFVRAHLPVAEAILERHEAARGPSGLLENVPGWVFVDWAQVGRDRVTAAHDALYAVALAAYASLPGACPVDELLERTRSAFELLWDADRGVYVDTLTETGSRGRRVSQQTNAAALLGSLVPAERVAGVVAGIVDPGPEARGGRLVVTATPADAPALGGESLWATPSDFDEDVDVVAAQPFFCHVLHAALHRAGRVDLVLASLRRWLPQIERGTFQEYWSAPPGTSSRCHGWASCPTHDLVAYVVGLRPTAPGFARAVLAPSLGPLSRASVRVPTPHGWLSAEVTATSAAVEVPEGVALEVAGAELGRGRHRVPLARS